MALRTRRRTVLLGSLVLCLSGAGIHFGQEPRANDPNRGQEWQDSEQLLKSSNDEQLKTFLGGLPKDYRHKSDWIAMRDGTKLAAEIGLPPGEGPFPIYFRMSAYSRFSQSSYYKHAPLEYGEAVDGKPVKWGFIAVNFRGILGSEGTTVLHNSAVSPQSVQVNDVNDAIEWIAKQPWSNGIIIMGGGSGNGVGPIMAKLANNPHVVYTMPGSSSADYVHGWGLINGLRRGMCDWFGSQTSRDSLDRFKPFPVPTIVKNYNPDKYRDAVLKFAASQKNVMPMFLRNGWYDLTYEDSLLLFEAYAPQGNVFLTIGPNAHGAISARLPIQFKSRGGPGSPLYPADLQRNLFLGKKQAVQNSKMLYYVLGDPLDKSAPGNNYRVTERWPVANTPTSFYLTGSGGLARQPPEARSAFLEYAHDPKNPIKTHGGANYLGLESEPGPWDQRDLIDRKDILRFASEPLDAPLIITGKMWAEIHLETDAPDTAVLVDLIDIYPDGYQAMIRDSGMMARYHSGWDAPSPLQPGKVYKLRIDMMSIALAFNKGHRIGLQVRSSSKPKFEVHPNTYEPVDSYDKSRVAHQRIHLSKQYPSRLVLPVVGE